MDRQFIAKDYSGISAAVSYLTGVEVSPDNPIEVLIRPYSERRTELQRRTYWGWYLKNLEQALEDAGYCITDDDDHEWPYTKDILHDMFKEWYLCYGEIRRKGKIRKLYWSTNDLPKSKSNNPTKPTFSEYIDKIKKFASQHWQIELEDPINGEMRRYYEECMR